MASEGIVCSIFVRPITGLAQRGERVSQMPAGIARMAANSMAAPVSQRCSSVSVAISPPYCDRNEVLMRHRCSCSHHVLRSTGRDGMPGHTQRSQAARTEGIDRGQNLREPCLRQLERCDPRDRVLHRDRGLPAERWSRTRCSRSRSMSCISARVSGSSAPKGSSMSRIFGSAANARASPTRCLCPPES